MRNIGKNNIRKRALALLMAVVMIISLLISGGSSSLDFVNAEGEQDLWLVEWHIHYRYLVKRM